MTERSLQITCRTGRAFAAYLYLPHATGAKSATTQASLDGLLVVDYAADGRAIGVGRIAEERERTFNRSRALSHREVWQSAGKPKRR